MASAGAVSRRPLGEGGGGGGGGGGDRRGPFPLPSPVSRAHKRTEIVERGRKGRGGGEGESTAAVAVVVDRGDDHTYARRSAVAAASTDAADSPIAATAVAGPTAASGRRGVSIPRPPPKPSPWTGTRSSSRSPTCTTRPRWSGGRSPRASRRELQKHNQQRISQTITVIVRLQKWIFCPLGVSLFCSSFKQPNWLSIPFRV